MKVVIIGAGRSGTNLLRDIITSFNEFMTWPCDEINYIWKHGNKKVTHDELTQKHATDDVKAYINKQFDKLQSKHDSNAIIVEKTCANSLRIEFVEEVLGDDAYYIHIVRDPVDTVASAMKRWTAELDIKYVLQKARFVPKSDLPYYGSKYILNRLKKFINKEKRLSMWGPKYNGMDELLQNKAPLHQVCAHQWKKCVERSMDQLGQIDSSRIYHLDYNNLVEHKIETLNNLFTFLYQDYSLDAIEKHTEIISESSIGKGHRDLTTDEVNDILEITSTTHERSKELT